MKQILPHRPQKGLSCPHLNSEILTFINVRHKSLLSKPPSSWCFVTAPSESNAGTGEYINI